MVRAWVTGAAGFIGSHLCRQLAGEGIAVAGIGHGSLPGELLAPLGLRHWINADIGAESLTQLLQDTGAPDQVYHLAGGSSVGSSFATPFEDYARTTVTTARLLDWLRTNAPQAKLVVISSAAVYGNTHDAPALETHTPSPESPYGYHKLAMELLCREYATLFGIKAVIVRLFSIYGEGLRKQLLWDVGMKLKSGTSPIVLGGTGHELRDWMHVADAARILQLSAGFASTTCPIFNGATGTGTAVLTVVAGLAAALHSKAEFHFSGSSRAGDPHALVADVGRIREAGMSDYIPLEEGLGRYAAWLDSRSP